MTTHQWKSSPGNRGIGYRLKTNTRVLPKKRTITVRVKELTQVKDHHGVIHQCHETDIYPECDIAKIFASIAGTDVLTQHTIDSIKKLGYNIIVKRETI